MEKKEIKKENITNNVTLFQNVIGHTSSKRVSGILSILTRCCITWIYYSFWNT